MPDTPDGGDGARPAVDFTQEIRFAVVMYGGSSLAIYINGVAQELFHLVRATAPERPDADGLSRRALLAEDELGGTERVYRKLGQMLVRGRDRRDPEGVAPADPLRTRFVIDVLTGTSAGGINAVFLAKALANDQSLDKLKTLWITQAGVETLLNDAGSDNGLGLGKPDRPNSLLNSRRMYWELLAAMRGMDDDSPAEDDRARSPYADELDLFVTATDMNGRLLHLRLADDVATERRHRNVFRFSYHTPRAGGADRNDFTAQYNPFLAFAARCTSAHPAAFEAMKLSDIDPVLKKSPAGGRRELGAEDPGLRKFYEEYADASDAGAAAAAADGRRAGPPGVRFQERPFNDGGVLDNSPFSFATESLPLRHADAPVDRKLIYIEPSPEHPELDEERPERPDFVSNALMSLSTLPRYQTIVEDIVRVLERNRLIERVSHITQGMEKDLRLIHGDRPPPKPSRDRFLDRIKDRATLLEWIRGKGTSWGSYQRLRVAGVTDDMALLVARAAGFSEESDEFVAVRYLVRDWRERNYDPHMEGGKKAEIAFLVHFDLLWLMRRVRFVLNKLNELSCLDENARRIAGVPRGRELSPDWPGEGEEQSFREAVLKTRRGLNAAYTLLRRERNRLWSRDASANPFRGAVAALEITSHDLLLLLREPTDQKRRDRATELLAAELAGQPDPPAPRRTRGQAVEDLTAEVMRELKKGIDAARALCGAAVFTPAPKVRLPEEGPPRALDSLEGLTLSVVGPLAPDPPLPATKWEWLLRRTLEYYYRNFDDYDLISYPILYSTDVGEEMDTVEVFRISPQDARSLIDERDGLRHLAGTTLGNFGAFFERRFRENDIMWGRLDGAERLVHALLPNEADRAARDGLIAEAHKAIIIEETMARHLREGDKAELRALVNSELALSGEGEDGRRLAARLAERLRGAGIDASLRSFLHTFLEGADLRRKFVEEFREGYQAARRFTPEQTLDTAARASRVFGRMLETYAHERGHTSRVLLWGARLSRWAWGLVEVAIPGRIPHIWARYLLKMLYLFELVLLVGGVAFGSRDVQQFGIVALLVTAALHVLLTVVGDYVRSDAGSPARGGLWWSVTRGLVPGLVIGALAGVLYFTREAWFGRAVDALVAFLQGLK